MATEYDAFADIYDLEYGTTTVDLDFYVEHAQAAQSPVLELACGTGRLALRVAEAGIPIVGIDSSERMLAVAREKAARLEESGAAPVESLPVEWVQADMRDFDLGRRFGLAMIPARSFLHLLDPSDQVQVPCCSALPRIARQNPFPSRLLQPQPGLIRIETAQQTAGDVVGIGRIDQHPELAVALAQAF